MRSSGKKVKISKRIGDKLERVGEKISAAGNRLEHSQDRSKADVKKSSK